MIKHQDLNHSVSYVLTHITFITYLVLISSDLNKAQIYEMPYRDSAHHEIETVMSFNYLNVFKRIEHTEDYHIRKLNDENFLFENGDKVYNYVG